MKLNFTFGSVKHRVMGPGWVHVGPNGAWIWAKFGYLNHNFDKRSIPNSRKKLFKKL